eukprot:1353078-Prymnesium_polylepis.1
MHVRMVELSYNLHARLMLHETSANSADDLRRFGVQIAMLASRPSRVPMRQTRRMASGPAAAGLSLAVNTWARRRHRRP